MNAASEERIFHHSLSGGTQKTSGEKKRRWSRNSFGANPDSSGGNMRATGIRIVAAILLILLGTGVFPAALMAGQPKVIHIFTALCDNRYQRIYPVSAALGNGQNPDTNLYWGAMYGIRTWFGKQSGWRQVKREKKPSAHLPYILERVIFRSDAENAWIVADAYDGKYMRECLHDFLQAASSGLPVLVTLGGKSGNLMAGGNSGLICFVGHNGLMEMSLRRYPAAQNEKKRAAAVFACQSRKYFRQHLERAGATPLVLTTGNMAPEAYSVHALISAWLAGKKPEQIREQVAQAYSKYQKSGISGARRLFSD